MFIANGVVRPEHGVLLLEDVNDLTILLLSMRRGVDPAKWIEAGPGGRADEPRAPSPVSSLM